MERRDVRPRGQSRPGDGHRNRCVDPISDSRGAAAKLHARDGALDIHTGAVHTTGLEHKGTALFCDLLDLVAREYADASRIHIILDNYVIHSSVAATRTLAAYRGRTRLHFLPPYCPDSNRIERVWQDLHANVTRNHRRPSLELLLGDARRYLVNYRWRERTGLAPLLSQNHDR